MSQTPLLNPDSAIWFVNGPQLFILSLVLMALFLICSMALTWIWAALLDEKRTFRESQAAHEQQLKEGHLLQLTPSGLTSTDIELAYTQTMPYHCLMCDRSFLMMTYHIYRLKAHPMSVFIFASHYCKRTGEHSIDQMRTLADDFNQAERAYQQNHTSALATQVMNKILPSLTDQEIDRVQVTAW